MEKLIEKAAKVLKDYDESIVRHGLNDGDYRQQAREIIALMPFDEIRELIDSIGAEAFGPNPDLTTILEDAQKLKSLIPTEPKQDESETLGEPIQKKEPDKVVTLIHTSEYRGDHSADITIAMKLNSDTTLGYLFTLEPDLNVNNSNHNNTKRAWIEIPHQTTSLGIRE